MIDLGEILESMLADLPDKERKYCQGLLNICGPESKPIVCRIIARKWMEYENQRKIRAKQGI